MGRALVHLHDLGGKFFAGGGEAFGYLPRGVRHVQHGLVRVFYFLLTFMRFRGIHPDAEYAGEPSVIVEERSGLRQSIARRSLVGREGHFLASG